jgi:hypothetical protein
MREQLRYRVLRNGAHWHWEITTQDRELLASGLSETRTKARAAALKQMAGPRTRSKRQEEALLACLESCHGSVAPYQRLCRILGYKSAGPRQLHLLRQYMSQMRRILAARRAPYVLAVAKGVGYALCPIAATRGPEAASVGRHRH